MMAKVIFTHRNGKERLIALRYAEVLQKVGRGTFRECDSSPHSEHLGARITKETNHPDIFSSEAVVEQVPRDEFDTMGRDALITFAEENSLHIDRRWGEEKLRNELREQMQ